MKKTLCLLLLFYSIAGIAQITDDSSKLVYGAKTTQIIYEHTLKNNIEEEIHPDTTLYELESFSEMDVREHRFQDLGNNGTAMRPIFYPVTEQIGRKSGFNVYEPFVSNPRTFRYYDTKSPFIDLYVVFGGGDQSVVDFTFTQNVNENWNFGFDIYRITSDKQLGRSRQGDRNVVGTVFDFFTYYKHATMPYSAMFHVLRMNHDVDETGGFLLEESLENATPEAFYEYEDADIQLNQAQAGEDRTNWHLYHQYAWQKQLQFYHQLDIRSQTVGYRDFRNGAADQDYTNFYQQFLLDTDSTYERYHWSEISNEIGIKGDLANLFYRIYLKRRDLDADYLYFDPTSKFAENFLGGYTRFDWRDKFNVEAKGEILQSGEYALTANLNSELIFGSYKSVRAKPAFIYERYFGNIHEWYNSFQSAFTNEITAGLQFKLDWVRVRPQGRLLTMDKFLYFDQEIMPRQSGDIAVLGSLGGDFDFTLYTNKALNEAFHFENELYYTSVEGAGANRLRVPDWFYNGRYYWSGYWFKNTLGVEVGADLHAKSSYYGMAYAPELQQFHLQDEFLLDGYFTIDGFFAIKVNNLRVFVKYTNANQPNGGGYMITPYYPGQRRLVGFGARWMFFD